MNDDEWHAHLIEELKRANQENETLRRRLYLASQTANPQNPDRLFELIRQVDAAQEDTKGVRTALCQDLTKVNGKLIVYRTLFWVAVGFLIFMCAYFNGCMPHTGYGPEQP